MIVTGIEPVKAEPIELESIPVSNWVDYPCTFSGFSSQFIDINTI